MRITLQLVVPQRTRRLLTFFSTTTTFKHHFQPPQPPPPHLSLSLSSPPPPSAMSTAAVDSSDAAYGFDRPDMYADAVGNTVDFYQRHLFLCYKSAGVWPSRIEDSADDRLPHRLNAALKARKNDLPLKTRLTIFEGSSETEYTDGDVLIFPDMVKYKGLKESDVDEFVEDVLVNGKAWASSAPESMVGAYVFVCAHGSRDKRCGVCGPVLLEKFKEEIDSRSLNDHIFVNACSHVGGHKYAGNLIIFGTDEQGKVIGDWYGYVTPADVPDLIDVHIGKGEIIKKLWRGQMGLKVEAAEKAVETKPSTEIPPEKTTETTQGNGNKVTENNTSSCCQGVNGGVSCCREVPEANGEVGEATPNTTSEKPSSKCSVCLPGWLGKWEQSDVLVAAGVVGAVATVAVAYSVFKNRSS